jgi:hypothetical protein
MKAQTAQVEALAQIRARNDAEIDKLKRKREKARRAREDALGSTGEGPTRRAGKKTPGSSGSGQLSANGRFLHGL